MKKKAKCGARGRQNAYLRRGKETEREKGVLERYRITLLGRKGQKNGEI